MAEVKLRKDFYGTKIPKVSSDSIRITVGFSYKGPAQTLDIETNTGKRGLWGDYDQESPTYHDSKAVYASDTFRSYTFSRSIPLSFWGDRRIDDCAVEVVIRGEGVYADAVIWDAYTVNIEVVGYILDVASDPIWGGTVSKSPDKDRYAYGEIVKLTAHPVPGRTFDYWTVNGEWLGYSNPINFMVTGNYTVTAHF